ncbi:hypothetical protein D9611_013234 [Ephemerocybe angulata]|uniref:Uncharacterized protein n=1 Tax=Ephemerocybe angulata TaxID=980116 RepID=A0A8H5CBJ5_9AGAR|nr:hypothetical protein D9611_013234 [Tulosesus angulatus]
MAQSGNKKSGKPNVSKKHASAKQAFKKNSKKANHKSQNAQLLEVLDQKALATIHEASNPAKPIQADFSAFYHANETKDTMNDLASIMQKI